MAQARIEIATYAPSHFAGIDALWRQAFPRDAPRNDAAGAIPAKLAFQPDLLLVALEHGAVVGSAMAGFDGYRGWLNRVAVLETHRRRGIGERLVREAEKRLMAMGLPKDQSPDAWRQRCRGGVLPAPRLRGGRSHQHGQVRAA